MTVRITRAKTDGNLTVWIEGRLEGADASGLDDELSSAVSSLTLDLSGLLSADPNGVRVLQSLHDRGAQLTGGSVYIRHLLADRSGCEPMPR